MEANIAPDLKALAYPVTKLRLLPGNFNSGDIEAVAKSLAQFGQRKPIVAKMDGKTGIILAGNTTFQAAKKLGWPEVAVSWADDLDETNATGYAIADNLTAKRAKTDEELLAEMMQKIQDDPAVLDASAYEAPEVDFSQLEEEIDMDSYEEENDEDESPTTPVQPPEREPGLPVIQYAIVFDTEEQQQRWFAFIRSLKKTYPGEDTIGGRIDAFLNDNPQD